MKQRKRVKESESRARDSGSVYRPSWAPYWKLLFLERAITGTNSDGPSDGTNSEDLSLATMVQNSRRYSDVSSDKESSEPDLTFVTMVQNPRISESFTTEDDSLSVLPEISTDVTEMSGGIIPHKSNAYSPKVSGRLNSGLHAGNAHLPIRIDDDIRDTDEIQNFEDHEVSGRLTNQTPLDSCAPLSPVPHSPTLSRPIFPPTDLTPSYSMSSFPLQSTSLPLNTPNSLALALPNDLTPPRKSRKRSFPNSDDNDIGNVFHDTIDSLRTVAESIREETNDDVSGFLRMIGFQLRSIDDPLRRMRVMHGIQGVILDQIASTVT